MSLLPEIENGSIVVEIPQVPTKKTKVHYSQLRRALRLERKGNRLRRLAEKNNKKKKKRKKFHKPKYHAYMKSPAWGRRKKEYYLRHKKECVICKSTRLVGLHHLTYKNLGREKDEDLVALCWMHHERYHEAQGVKRDNTATHAFIEQERQVEEMRLLANVL